MSDPKQALETVADLLHAQAVDAHAEGMSLIERSARIRQLAHILNEEEAEKLLRSLQEEGTAPYGLKCNADGGEA